jgi:hypothetical protein
MVYKAKFLHSLENEFQHAARHVVLRGPRANLSIIYIYIYICVCVCVCVCINYIEADADKTMYMVMSRDQKAGQSHSVKTDNSSFARVEQFKYLLTTLKNQNYIQEEIKSRLETGNSWFQSV